MNSSALLRSCDLESAMITRSVTQCSSQEQADLIQTGSAFFSSPHTAGSRVLHMQLWFGVPQQYLPAMFVFFLMLQPQSNEGMCVSLTLNFLTGD